CRASRRLEASVNRYLLNHWRNWLALVAVIAHSRRHGGDVVDDFNASDHLPDDHVFGGQTVIVVHDKKLAAVRIGTGIGHRHDPTAITLLINGGLGIDFIFKGTAPDALSARSVPLRIATLNHEAFNDPVKHQAVVIPAHGQEPEVLDCLWGIFGEQFDF